MTARVFTTTPGTAVRIDNYGEAGFATPAYIPDQVAAELAGAPGLRIEVDEPPAEEAVVKKTRKGQEV